MKSENEIRQEIINNRETNIFVEAGAGAGKTTLIVERIIRQLKDGTAPEKIAVITYTNKAVQELSVRIIKKVRELKLDVDVERMQISTIHSFCHKILTEHSFEAKLRPDVELVEEDRARELLGQVFDKWYSALKKEDLEKARAFMPYYLYDTLKNNFFRMCNIPDCEFYFPKEDFEGYNPEEEAYKTLKEIRTIFVNCFNILLEKDFKEPSEIYDYEHQYSFKPKKAVKVGTPSKTRDVLEYDIEKMGFAEFFTNLGNIKGLAKKLFLDKYPLSVLDEALEKIENLKNKAVSRYKLYKNVTVMELLLRARRECRLDSRYITNIDLLVKASRLIAENQAVRGSVAEEYDYIYVDEFQDTDDIQSAMVFALAEEAEKIGKKGMLFVVGDPRQSIYKFKGSEIDIYYRVKVRFEKNPDSYSLYQLNNNYRTTKPVMDWVDSQFREKTYFKKDSSYRGMVVADKTFADDDKLISGVYKCSVSEKKPDTDIDAEALGDVIDRLVKDGFKIMDGRDSSRCLRNIKYSDILVLTPGKTKKDCYRKVFMERGIPADFNCEDNSKKYTELKRFLFLFNCLAFNGDLKRKIGGLNGFMKEGAYINDRAAENKLEALRDRVKNMSALEIVGFLCDHEELLLPWDSELKENNIILARKNIRKMVETVISKGEGEPYLLSKAFSSYIEGKTEKEILLEENRDAIRFMNVHKAKGLEGKIVIIAARDRAKTFKNDSYCIINQDGSRKYYYSVSVGNVNWPAYAMDDSVMKAAKEAEEEENTRLDYVAATRAEEALIIMPALEKNVMLSEFDAENCINDFLGDIVIEEEEKGYSLYSEDNSIYEPCNRVEYISVSPSDFEKVGSLKNNRAEAAEVSENTEEEAAVISENTEEETAVIPEKSEAAFEEAENPDPKGNIFGLVLHRAYELFINIWKKDFTADTQPIIRECVYRAVMENDRVPKEEYTSYFNKASGILSQFVKDSSVRDMLENGDAIYTELEFSFFAEKDTDLFNWIKENKKLDNIDVCNRIWVNGIADLVLLNKDGTLTIADYKSDYKAEEKTDEEFRDELQRKYQGQLELYRQAMSRLFKISPDKISTRIINYQQ